MTEAATLEVRDLESGYRKKRVLAGVSLHVADGEVVTLVGPNGAGKTTLLRTIVGLNRPWSGTLHFAQRDAIGRTAAQNARDGLVLVPQGGRVFGDLTVLENLRLGAFLEKDRHPVEERLEKVYEIFPVLRERCRQRGGTLSGGERQMLAVARGLMLNPRLLLLDEPSVGLAPILVTKLMDSIREINRQLGTTILMVEQTVREAFRIADRAYVMRVGQIVLEREHPGTTGFTSELIESYLGPGTAGSGV